MARMNLKQFCLTLATVGLFLAVAGGDPRIDGNKSSKLKDQTTHQNEIEDRFYVAEPYKSLLQTTTRFALAQTKISNVVNIDTAMSFLNDIGFMLSKPATLLKAIKALAVSIASFLATTVFFPGAYQFIETLWRDPIVALNLDKHFSNGISEKSVLGILGSKTDDALSRVGLYDNSCREKSLCYTGDIIKCTFPESAQAITKFASDNFPNSSYKENKYVAAFLSGFVDQNCTKVNMEGPESRNCISNFIGSMLKPRWNSDQRTKYQTVIARA